MIRAPSILTIDKENRTNKINDYLENGIEMLHVDIMDGKFVPNKTLGSALVKEVRSFKTFIDTHLMIENPIDYIDEYIVAGSNLITFHVEATDKIKETIDLIHSKNCKAGIAIKPNTSVNSITEYLKYVDLVLVMSVEPGFGGQKFMDSALPKIAQLSNLRTLNKYNYLIEADGGINLENSKMLALNGCDIVVMGTFLLKAENVKKIVEDVKIMSV